MPPLSLHRLRRMAASVLLATMAFHGVLELAALTRFPGWIQRWFADEAGQTACSVTASRALNFETSTTAFSQPSFSSMEEGWTQVADALGICGLNPQQMIQQLPTGSQAADANPSATTSPAMPSSQSQVATQAGGSCCSASSTTPAKPAAPGCKCCSNREGGCPMGGQCRCGQGDSGKAVAGLFFQMPGCHTTDANGNPTAVHSPESFRFQFLQTAASPFDMTWSLDSLPQQSDPSLQPGHNSPLITPPRPQSFPA
jgi:hypothetical protein